MLKEILEEVRKKEPLIHSIMNRVSINDCANLLLACGASPIMADEEGEVEEITASSAGLVLNMGMLSQRVIPAMMKAGIKGNEIGIPVILDPVGAGISSFRREDERSHTFCGDPGKCFRNQSFIGKYRKW